ncbi:scaffold protein Nfu/NifU N terminal-domain-containing protein [Thamnocephalis sphaerospora]|uniref:Scaffold protein Nfu/NifU N terminal-domain-containing protein n=1 Tax=Thamnocephalis sphaerospora TaxID=78915 RepID=A0A4P9XW52_9FUNG|nr:scaffold protein Nfu/NifU N terminal-domain-containing protein [Thamnocephalis sphaerospora]|eukprot:RKP10528.1 scaffold protein Nfu/NifU N terminal-domain-containing protein [Thamnocephalis sphaerospora]
MRSPLASRTPVIRAHQRIATVFEAHQQARTMFIQNELTPNKDAIKFIPGERVLPEGVPSIEYVDPRSSFASPLAKMLFQIEGVKHVFLGSDFITVTKDPLATWQLMKPDIYSAIMDFYSSGQPIITDEQAPSDTAILDDDPEPVKMIKELLDTRIRPAIQEDGGDVEYRGFTAEGLVKLKLKGACRTCDSSVVTLRNGIENMLKHYVPEVTAVEQELDPEDEVSQEEFDKLEKRLNGA